MLIRNEMIENRSLSVRSRSGAFALEVAAHVAVFHLIWRGARSRAARAPTCTGAYCSGCERRQRNRDIRLGSTAGSAAAQQGLPDAVDRPAAVRYRHVDRRARLPAAHPGADT